MLHIYNYEQFWDEANGRPYANFYNDQIQDELDNISPENLQLAIDDVEEIIKQTKIKNGLISTKSKNKKKWD
jgi:hypothetical protein